MSSLYLDEIVESAPTLLTPNGKWPISLARNIASSVHVYVCDYMYIYK